jgi:CRISPR/Cas system-associated endonuclease Cas1
MSEKQAIGFLNSPHGKYMGEYLTPGMDYSHEAFLDKLEEYYNERMLNKYAKDFVNLSKVSEGFFSRLFRKKEDRDTKKEIDQIKNKIENADVQDLFKQSINNLEKLDNVMAAIDAADPSDVDDAFSKYRKSNSDYINFVKVLKGSHQTLEDQYGKDAIKDLGIKSKNMLKAYSAKADKIAKDIE